MNKVCPYQLERSEIDIERFARTWNNYLHVVRFVQRQIMEFTMSPSHEVANALPRNRRLSTVVQFCQKHQDLTESAVRWLIHQSKPRHHAKSLTKPNGFDMVIFRRGRRVLLDEDQYALWLEMQQKHPSGG